MHGAMIDKRESCCPLFRGEPLAVLASWTKGTETTGVGQDKASIPK